MIAHLRRRAIAVSRVDVPAGGFMCLPSPLGRACIRQSWWNNINNSKRKEMMLKQDMVSNYDCTHPRRSTFRVFRVGIPAGHLGWLSSPLGRTRTQPAFPGLT